MTKFVSRRGTLGIAKEASKGTPVVPAYWVPVENIAFADKAEQAAESQGLGNIADQDSIYVTLKTAEGDVDAQLYDQAIPYMLMSLLGAAPVTTGTNPYTHTFTLSNTNVPQTLSLYYTDPDRDYMFPQAVVESLKISVAPTGIVEYTIHFKSKTARNWTHQVPSFTTIGSKFLHQHLIFKLASTVGALGAASNISLKNLELTFDRKTMFDTVMGTVEPEDILSQELSIEGSLELNLEDDTYRNYMLNGTYKAMEIHFANGANSDFDLVFPRVNFSEWEPDLKLGEIAKQKVNFKANYDSANAQAIVTTATVINTKTSY
jgi:hypothetical protein